MLVVAALGGNALLERGEAPLAEIQEKHVAAAVEALAPLARHHDLVVTHGNGPQVGLLALESARDPELSAPLPVRRPRRPDPGDDRLLPAPGVRERPARPGGGEPDLPDPGGPGRPGLRAPHQVRGAGLHGWRRPDASAATGGGRSDRTGRRGDGWWPHRSRWPWSRCPPSGCWWPTEPLVICAGGGGIPVRRGADGLLHGVEAVVDKDLTAALLARELGADTLLLLTDVAQVEIGFGTGRRPPDRANQPRVPADATLPVGLDGSEGRRRLPVRRGHRWAGGHRSAGGCRRSAGRHPGHRRRAVARRGVLRRSHADGAIPSSHIEHTGTTGPAHRIVVGVDGSEHAGAALDWAADRPP